MSESCALESQVTSQNAKECNSIHTEEKPYQCKQCDKSFKTIYDIKIHHRTHTGEKPYRCCQCEKSFSVKSNLVRHQKTHTGEKPYRCCQCEKSFSDKSNFVKHQKIHTGEKTHTGEKPYTCCQCEKTFSVKSNFVRHQKTHTGEKPFQCAYCEESFTKIFQLKIHHRTHAGEKPYRCHCEKAFSFKRNFVRHQKIHTREKPFQCNVCSETFSTKDDLDHHIKYLHKHLPLKCQLCHTDFSRKDNLHRHMLAYHNNDYLNRHTNLHVFVFQGIRLLNHQNDCYLNSCFNAILSINDFKDQILSSNNTHYLIKTIQGAINEDGLSNVRILKNLHQRFQNENQHDATDFLEVLLENLEFCLPGFSDSFIVNILTNRHCQSCQTPMRMDISPDCFLRLTVDRDNINIQMLIDEYTQEHTIVDSHCNYCQGRLRAKYQVVSPPKVIFIQLCRFVRYHVWQKLRNCVVPSESIILEGVSYRLKSIIQHHGEDINSGHYTTMLHIGNTWVQCNDTNIVQNCQPSYFDGYVYLYEFMADSHTQNTPAQLINDLHTQNMAPVDKENNKAHNDINKSHSPITTIENITQHKRHIYKTLGDGNNTQSVVTRTHSFTAHIKMDKFIDNNRFLDLYDSQYQQNIMHSLDENQLMMRQDIDGELSNQHVQVFYSQDQVHQTPPDMLQEDFLCEYNDQLISNVLNQQENNNQELSNFDLVQLDTDTVQQKDTELLETFQPRRSSRLAAKHSVHQINLPKQPKRSVKLYNIARHCDVKDFDETFFFSTFKQHYAGSLFDSYCPYCKAYRWTSELTSICCKNGKISLPEIQNPPETIVNLYKSNSFLEKLVWYNNALALTSLGCSEVRYPGFNPIFKIQGKLYHSIGSLLPKEGHAPRYAQIYLYDTDHQIQHRLGKTDLNKCTMVDLQQTLHNVNSYIKSFKAAAELITKNTNMNIVLHHKKSLKPSDAHCRSYNLPTSSEVAALVSGDAAGDRDLILSARDGSLKRISIYHRSYDPLQYVLMFPHGDDGWELDMYSNSNRKISGMDFYSYRLQIRKGHFNIIMKSRRLMQTYSVDQWCKVESSRLGWAKAHQNEIKLITFSGLLDAIAQDDLQDAGQRIILPPTIYGSPRFYEELYFCSMALVQIFGKPDYFITVTTNPKWKEIKESLFPGEQVKDRPDLSVRVFKMKFDSIMEDLLKNDILGKVIAHSATIEWQKRGLTHVHILLIMKDSDKPKTPEMIDMAISAEIPDQKTNPKLYKVITENNIHGPCGTAINADSPCMGGVGVHRHCTKDFPKPFSNATTVREDSYPQYRRRGPQCGGQTYTIDRSGFIVDNSWVVPYNPFLSLKYECHINCESVATIGAVKYLFKYITKGNDRVIIQLDSEGQPKEVVVHDEIENFVNVRYVSASEALWKLYRFPIHSRKPAVEKLPCHLENEQMTIIPKEVNPDPIVPPVTKLTAFFELNKHDDLARNILYSEIPKYFTWQKGSKNPYTPPHWQRRKKGILDENYAFTSDAVGRIPIITFNVHQSELFYFRMLLYHQKGPTCHNDLKKLCIDGQDIICESFREACQKLGLIVDDKEIEKAMNEACLMRFGDSLRDFFCSMLILCIPANPYNFWNYWKTELCRDKMLHFGVSEPSSLMIHEVLFFIKNRLKKDGLSMEKFNLPEPDIDMIKDAEVIQDEPIYNEDVLKSLLQERIPTLNEAQKNVFDQVMSSVENKQGKIYCLNAGGGTGKTYLNNILTAAVYFQGKIAIPTALSGIAATLLEHGRTLHSRCNVPIRIRENSTCRMSKLDDTGKLFQKADLLIIDEVSMGHRHIFECLDRTLKYLRDDERPFGGMTVLFTGDWRQILPVVLHGSRAQTVHATLKKSSLWNNVIQVYLHQNMRLDNSEKDTVDFHRFLTNIGNGTGKHLPMHGEFATEIPHELIVHTPDDLFKFVFGDLQVNFKDSSCLSSRAIIAPTNRDVDMINYRIINDFPGRLKIYKSADRVEENQHQYPLEFINKLTPSGFPNHELKLKVNATIILLRNFNPSKGHCNGTRYVIKQMSDHVLDAVVATGEHAGERLFIPRIPMTTDPERYPFHMTRRQFPVRLAFAITANKSQGQTLKKVGIYLGSNFFSHGQFYVACSRVQSSKNLKIYIKDKAQIPYTDNVVYKEIL